MEKKNPPPPPTGGTIPPRGVNVIPPPTPGAGVTPPGKFAVGAAPGAPAGPSTKSFGKRYCGSPRSTAPLLLLSAQKVKPAGAALPKQLTLVFNRMASYRHRLRRLATDTVELFKWYCRYCLIAPGTATAVIISPTATTVTSSTKLNPAILR